MKNSKNTKIKSSDIGPWPLMRNNIHRGDLDNVIKYLEKDDPILTQSKNVIKFEEEWSKWLGVKHSIFVNSGSSANLLTIAALRKIKGNGEIIVPTLTWSSDISSVLLAGFKPVFVDINPLTLGMNLDEVIDKITKDTKAVFITHVLGLNSLDKEFLNELKRRDILLIEDCCESHGAIFDGKLVGSIGWASNFSFYYAHHISTIEGGMICTNDDELNDSLRMYRSHGMVRESSRKKTKIYYQRKYPNLNPDFIFAYPGYNVRGMEINAIIGRNQLKRLNKNIKKRTQNFKVFLKELNPQIYRTDFNIDGSSNYALILILKKKNIKLRNKIEEKLKKLKVEFRRGTAGGGNQLMQPYLKETFDKEYLKYKYVNHVHKYGWYIGNYPDLDSENIKKLAEVLNNIE